MDFSLTDTQQMLAETARRFFAEHGTLERWRLRRKLQDGCDREVWRHFAEMGWLALPMPEDTGGLGGTIEDVALLMIELGRGLSIEPYPVGIVLATHVLAAASGDRRNIELMRGIAAGEILVAIACQEAPTFTSTAPADGILALREGDEYVLDGLEMMSLGAPAADYLLIAANLEDSRSIFLIARNTAGVILEAYPLIDGTHAADLVMSNVRVPHTAMIASGEAARTLLQGAIYRTAIAYMAQAVGAMEAACDLTGSYVSERRQFGVPIGTFQAVQHLAVDMYVAAFQARSALYLALAGLHGDSTNAEKPQLLARRIVAQATQVVGRNGIQCHGGYGITDEYAISHYYKRLLTLEILLGGAFSGE